VGLRLLQLVAPELSMELVGYRPLGQLLRRFQSFGQLRRARRLLTNGMRRSPSALCLRGVAWPAGGVPIDGA
jgi:hypothetical protein